MTTHEALRLAVIAVEDCKLHLSDPAYTAIANAALDELKRLRDAALKSDTLSVISALSAVNSPSVPSV